MKRMLLFALWIIWIVIVFILLTLPAKDFGNVEISIPNFDKVVHAGLFGGIVFWYGISVIHIEKNRTKTATIIVTVLACIYGIVMEYVQKYCLHPPRDFSYGDMLADSIGAVLAFYIIRWITKKYQLRYLPKNTMKS